MSPRAAWRLESIGFAEVYDYVGSKMDWVGAGLPFEGSDAAKPRLGTLADPAVPTCALDEKVGHLRGRLEGWDLCVVVNEARVVLGLVRAEAAGLDDGRPVVEVMRKAPKTYRPHLAPADVLPALENRPAGWLLVTNLDGTLVGVARPERLRQAQGHSGG